MAAPHSRPKTFGDTSNGPDLGQNLINWSNDVGGAITDALLFRPSTSPGDPTPDSHGTKGGATQDKKVDPEMSQPPTPPATDIASYLNPLTSELTKLPDEYAKAITQINNLPDSGTATPVNPAVANIPGEAANKANDAALQAANTKVTNDLGAGETAIKNALAKEGPAAKTLVQDLPYADILSTTLASKKNQLLYGTSPATVFKPADETGWPQGVKDIYNYIEGNSSGNSVVGAGAGGIPTSIPGITGQATNTSGTGSSASLSTAPYGNVSTPA